MTTYTVSHTVTRAEDDQDFYTAHFSSGMEAIEHAIYLHELMQDTGDSEPITKITLEISA